MEKKILNVELLQSFIDATQVAATKEAAVTKAQAEAVAAQIEVDNISDEVRNDLSLVRVLTTTGIKTLNDKLITIDINGDIDISDYSAIPAMWEFK